MLSFLYILVVLFPLPPNFPSKPSNIRRLACMRGRRISTRLFFTYTGRGERPAWELSRSPTFFSRALLSGRVKKELHEEQRDEPIDERTEEFVIVSSTLFQKGGHLLSFIPYPFLFVQRRSIRIEKQSPLINYSIISILLINLFFFLVHVSSAFF